MIVDAGPRSRTAERDLGACDRRHGEHRGSDEDGRHDPKRPTHPPMVREAHVRLASGRPECIDVPATLGASPAATPRHTIGTLAGVRQGWPITVIAVCWIAWLVVWLVMAFTTKRTVESSTRSWSSVSVIVLFLAWVRVRGVSGDLHDGLWAPSTPLSVLTVGLVVAGFAFTVWARAILGRNWSGSVVIKEDHELVEKGPYALVRHPIYTGLLSMMLGTALYYAEPLGFILFAVGVVVLYLKSLREEQLMTSHFPDEYPEYRRRVKALVPYVL